MLSREKKTLYWTNLTGHAPYSVPTAVPRDFGKAEAELKAAVTKVAELPSSTDGLTADRHNNLYITALELNGLTGMPRPARSRSTGATTTCHGPTPWVGVPTARSIW